jgi:uncharacterized membrane protein HdeD (DUF308 family)
MALISTTNWWALALRGLFAVLFGVFAFVMPGITLAVLILWFGAYVLVDGIFTVIAAIKGARGTQRWWALLLQGIVSILAGVLTFIWPGITALGLLFLIAAWMVVTGTFQIAAAIRLRKQIEGEWLLLLGGVLSILLGFLFFAFPGAGAIAMVWWIGSWVLVFGILLIALGFKLRSIEHAAGGPDAVGVA